MASCMPCVQGQTVPGLAYYWLRHLALATERIPHLSCVHQARLPVLLFESCVHEQILYGTVQHSHAALAHEWAKWTDLLRGNAPQLPECYWAGLSAASQNPSVGTARPVFANANVNGRPR